MSKHPPPQPLLRRPTVTVVVPCFNYGHYLPVALASVLGQPGVDVDVIAIDDASPDGSGAVLRQIGESDERIRVILHRSNRGHIATYNEGLELARGEYVAVMSADDALTPGALARATALLDAEPSVAFVYGFPIHFKGELPTVDGKIRSWTVWSGEEWVERRCRRGDNCIASPEVVMRSSVQRAIGGYDSELPFSGDLEMWLRAASVGSVGRVNGAPQAYYRVHDRSMQRTIYTGFLNELEGRLAAFEKVLAGPSARLDRGEELFAQARRSLAVAALKRVRVAFDNGRSELEPIDDYVAFAEVVWPQVRTLRLWRATQRLVTTGGGGRDPGLAGRGRRATADLAGRVRWRRWRWSGV
jgi:Glycosyl transferase family 2